MSNDRVLVSVSVLALLLCVLPAVADQASPPLVPYQYPAAEMNRLDREHPGVMSRFEARTTPLLDTGDMNAYKAEVGRMASQTEDPILAAYATQAQRIDDPAEHDARMAYERAVEAFAPADQVQFEAGGGYQLFRRSIPLSQLIPGVLDFIQLSLANTRPGEEPGEDPLRQLFLDKLNIRSGTEHEAALIRATLEADAAKPSAEEKKTAAPAFDAALRRPRGVPPGEP